MDLAPCEWKASPVVGFWEESPVFVGFQGPANKKYLGIHFIPI
jgi:hypothetical protein